MFCHVSACHRELPVYSSIRKRSLKHDNPGKNLSFLTVGTALVAILLRIISAIKVSFDPDVILNEVKNPELFVLVIRWILHYASLHSE